MKYVSKKFVCLSSFIILYLVLRVFLFKGSNIVNYTNLINPLFWIAMSIVAFLFCKDESEIRQRSKFDIIQTTIIILILYLMIYFSLGLVVGYEKSPYSHDIIAIVKNFWSFASIIIFQEYTRYQMIKLSPKKGWAYVLIALLFVITEISFWSVSSNFGNNVDFFRYMSETIIPLIVTNALFMYLAVSAGFVPSLVYRLVMVLMTLLLPIFPSLNWLLKTMMDIVLVIITALYVNYVQIKSNRILSKRDVKREKITSYIPFIIILIVMVCFIGGMFKYQPIAVLSNSMVPQFARGDAVIIEKITNNSLKNLKKNNIIYYKKDGNLIVHRIIDIQGTESGNMKIKTKGDNNNTEDVWTVLPQDIIGVVRFMIPYIGYPSVLVNELLG